MAGKGGGEALEIEMYERENQSGPIGVFFKFDSIDFHLVHDDQIKVIVRGSIKCISSHFRRSNCKNSPGRHVPGPPVGGSRSCICYAVLTLPRSRRCAPGVCKRKIIADN